MWRDLERICFDLDLPFRQPEPFPQNGLLAARVALIGLSGSWGEEFCRGVFRAEFGEGRQIDDPTIISDILSQLHIESASVLEAARAETNKAALRTQTEEAKQLGIFGAPTFTTADGELFWGNDRLERAIAWARTGVDLIARNTRAIGRELLRTVMTLLLNAGVPVPNRTRSETFGVANRRIGTRSCVRVYLAGPRRSQGGVWRRVAAITSTRGLLRTYDGLLGSSFSR